MHTKRAGKKYECDNRLSQIRMWKTRADVLECSVDEGVVADTESLSGRLTARRGKSSTKERTTIPDDRIRARSPHSFLLFLEGNLIRGLASRDPFHVVRNG